MAAAHPDIVHALEAVADEYTRRPVPASRAVSGWQLAMVCMGITITLPALYSGGELARGLGLGQAVAAVLTGALILGVMSIPAAVVGLQTRLSSYMIIEHVFGRVGAKIINGCFGLVLLGWYALTAEFFGHTLHLAAREFAAVNLPEAVWILLSSGLVMLTTVFGFRAIDRLAVVAVPLLALMLCAISARTLLGGDLPALLAMPVGDMAFSRGVSVVIGTMIVGVVLMPDFTRYARNLGDCLTASFLGNAAGIVLSTCLAMAPSMLHGSLDPMIWLTAMGIGAVALPLLVLATWTTNGANLYSVGLVVGSATHRAGYGTIVIATGTAGTVAALFGVTEHFIEFLELLGLLVPPVAAVYLTRYFLLGRRDFHADTLPTRPAIAPSAMLATLLGGGISAALWFAEIAFTGIAALESLLLSAVLYLVLDRLLPEAPATVPATADMKVTSP